MQKKINRRRKTTKISGNSENEAEYIQAQRLLRDIEEGYVMFDRIFANDKEVFATFSQIVSGDLLYYMGHQFFWKRQSDGPLILYGQNPYDEDLKGRGPIEICSLRVPEVWVGTGRWRIYWPDNKNESDPTLFLITLYLYSTNPDDFGILLTYDEATAAFMACLYLEKDNAERFEQPAKERYTSLS